MANSKGNEKIPYGVRLIVTANTGPFLEGIYAHVCHFSTKPVSEV